MAKTTEAATLPPPPETRAHVCVCVCVLEQERAEARRRGVREAGRDVRSNGEGKEGEHTSVERVPEAKGGGNRGGEYVKRVRSTGHHHRHHHRHTDTLTHTYRSTSPIRGLISTHTHSQGGSDLESLQGERLLLLERIRSAGREKVYGAPARGRGEGQRGRGAADPPRLRAILLPRSCVRVHPSPLHDHDHHRAGVHQ